MIEILPTENDDEKFIKLVEQISNVGINLAQPEEVFIIKINHWFDFKWKSFSHKIFGAVGVWRDELRIPPFIPDRVVEETYFQKTGKIYEKSSANQLHIYQPGENNTRRKIKRKSAFFIWFSGETAKNSQGSLMLYVFLKDFQDAWYVSFINKSDWQIYKTDNISKAEVKAMIENDYLALMR